LSPEQLITNVTTLAQALMPGGGTLAALVGTLAYGYGKAADSPQAVSWGKKGWIGAGVLFGGTAVIGLVQNISGRIFA
jgi:hypothetical protein